MGKKLDGSVRGPALVERAIAALAIRAPRPVPKGALAGLALGDAPLPPSLEAWLAHHARLPRPFRAPLSADGLALTPWPGIAMRALGRPVLPAEPPPPLSGRGLLPLDCGSDSFRALVVAGAGEPFVVDVDADSASVTLAMPGFDVWLAVVAGLVAPADVRARYRDALRALTASQLGGAEAWVHRGAWHAVAESPWEPPPYPRARASTDGPTELVETIRDGDLEGVRDLLDAGLSAAEPDAQGRTPVGTAAACAAPEILGLLLERGAPPDAPDGTGMTPLSFIAQVDWWWYAKQTPRLDAGWLRCMRLLAAAGADPNGAGPPLAFAASRRSLALVSTLVDLGADPRRCDVLLALLAKGPKKTRPAHDLVACLRLLLDRGADPHARDATGRSLLAVAADDPKMPKAVSQILREHGVT